MHPNVTPPAPLASTSSRRWRASQVHRGFLRAFQSVVANKLPGYTLEAVAQNLTGVRPAEATMCAPRLPGMPTVAAQACQRGSSSWVAPRWCGDITRCTAHAACV